MANQKHFVFVWQTSSTNTAGFAVFSQLIQCCVGTEGGNTFFDPPSSIAKVSVSTRLAGDGATSCTLSEVQEKVWLLGGWK